MIDQYRVGAYQRIYEQLKGLIENKSPNLLAAMTTINAVTHAKLKHHFWTGFYFVHTDNELHIGPYQGAVACQILRDGGVCLACVKAGRPIVVPDVHLFPGHIACDSRSQSEIVIPLIKQGKVIAVFDVDSDRLNQFDEDDIAPLEKIISLALPYL